jgi:hypothetical protein
MHDVVKRKQRKDVERWRAAAKERERLLAEAWLARNRESILKYFADRVYGRVPTADDFLFKRLNGVPLDKFDDAVRHALADLMASDVPLDPFWRRMLANDYRSLCFEKQGPRLRRARNEAFAATVKSLKAHLRRKDDLTATAAEAKVAEIFSVSVDAMRKRLQRV